MKKNNVTRQFMPYMVLIIVILGTLVFYSIGQTKVNKLTYDELIVELSKDKVESIEVTPKSNYLNIISLIELTNRLLYNKLGYYIDLEIECIKR